jgi:acetyl-CoA carboxylase biotin carboxyl carrier protein
MIDLEFVEKLIHALDQSSVDHVEIERGGTRILVSKSPSVAPGAAMPAVAPAPAVPPSAPNPASASPAPAPEAPASSGGGAGAAPDPNLVEITSPMVGTFYRSPAPDADAFVEAGSKISKGDVLCIIEAMKLMNELEAEIEGTIREICVENAEPVEYGQVLFRVQPG